MTATFEERKIKALKFMKELKINEPYIKVFKEKNDVCFFEGFEDFWAWQEPEIQNKIKELEKEYNCTVYAITHEFTEFGELYDFLIVTEFKEEWKYLLRKNRKTFYAFAYVWNKDNDSYSELGTIGLQSFGGGIRRIQ